MKSTLDKIDEIKRNGYSIDFATVFDRAFENYKKIALYSGLIILVFSIIFGIFFMGGIIAYYGPENINEDFIKNFGQKKPMGTELLLQVLLLCLITGLTAPFGAGFLKMADSADRDVEFKVSGIFTYYRGKYFLQIFIAAFIPALIGTSIASLIDSLGIELLGTAFSFMISYLMYLSIPLVVFGNLNGIDAIKSSLVLVGKNPFMIFAFFILGFIGSLIGIVACVIPVIFTVVFNSSMMYATYFAIFTTENNDSIDSIGESDID